ncbi:hypothetical protein LXL04_035947 [Taraxacum kok-saghyz]
MASSCWPESLPSSRIKAIEELTQGQHLTTKLRRMLRQPQKIEPDVDSVDDVVKQILGMFDNTLSILNSSSFNEVADVPSGDVRSPTLSSLDDQKSEDYGESSKTVTPMKVKRGCYKRRKDSWTSIKIAPTLFDDGYAWRKYGQKVILNAKHQRNYYRCTHKTEQGCRATKQVQKTEDEPPQYKITYSGYHTCQNIRTPLIILDSDEDQKDNSFVLNFETPALNKNKQVDSCFPSTKHDQKENFPSLSFRNNQASPSDDHYLPWNLTTQVSEVPSEPMSMMSSGLDHEDMISSEVYSSTCSTNGYEIDNLLIRSNGFSDFPFEFSCWPESLPSSRIKAIEELTQGQHLTTKLRRMLRQPQKIDPDVDSVDDVVKQILGMFDNTLSILNSSSFNEVADVPSGDVRSPTLSSLDDQKSEDYGESSKTVTPMKVKRGCYKRRKDSWTSIKIAPTLIDDGYAWRKYGQKVILNAKHQRNYYRCTHKTEQGCRATKQVQKTEDEPPQYKLTYSGYHTCQNIRTPLIILDSDEDQKDNSFVLNFETPALNKNKQVDSCFPSTKHDKKESFPSLSFRNNQASPSDDHYLPWNLTTQVSEVPSEPMSMMSSGLDHEDMISSEVYSSTCSTNGYEIDNLLRSNGFSDFPFELCS